MFRPGRALYVVRDRVDEIAALRLDRTGPAAWLVRTITHVRANPKNR